MRWGLAEGSLARSKWWRRVVDAVGVEVAEVVVVEVEVDLRAPSSSSLSSTLTSILLGFLYCLRSPSPSTSSNLLLRKPFLVFQNLHRK